MRSQSHVRSITRAAIVLAAIAIAVACSSSKTSSNSTSSGGGDTGTVAAQNPATALAKAEAATKVNFKGNYTNVSPESRPAAKNKSVIIISASQASISSSVPANGAAEAAKKLGWKTTIYDAQLNPSKYAPLVRQAVTAKPDGIILVAIDCQNVQQPLQQAKNAGIKVVAIYAFDCNDAHAGGASSGLFSASINYGAKAANVDKFTESYGADQAQYIIAATKNKAKIIAIQDPEFTVLYYTLKGFTDTINASGGSKIVDTLNVTSSDITTGKIQAKVQAELLRHPEADWVKSPYTYVTQLGIAPSLGAKAGTLHVMGGEGFAPELDLIRQGKVTAVNIISSTWTGWASADTLNSAFLGKAPANSGIGWVIADKDHNVPPTPGSEYVPTVDFKAEYAKAWGVS
jgi:ribose transport system substrate-binding protein